jgi:hypothetical protein
MDVRLAAYASELTKIAAQQDGQRQSYADAMAKAAPYALVTGVADVPKGFVDKAVEKLIRGSAKSKGESALLTAVGRGGARLGAGLLTAPVFLSGIKDLKSDEKERKVRGAAKVVGSGLVYSALKGGGEAAVGNLMKDPKQIWRAVKNTAGARSIVGAGAALLTAYSAAKATKDSKDRMERGDSVVGKIIRQGIIPAAVGTAAGAGKGAFEEVWDKAEVLKPLWRGKKIKVPSIRGVVSKAGGRAASGALGALVLTHAVKHLMPSKKNPNVKRWQRVDTQKVASSKPPSFGPTPGELYGQVRTWAKESNDVDVYHFYKSVNQDGVGERSPSRRAAFYALHDELTARGHKMPAPKRRKDVSGPLVKAPGVLGAAALGVVAAAPPIAAAAVNLLPPTDRDRVLADALDRMIIQKGIARRTLDPDAPFFDLPFGLNEAAGVEDSRFRSIHYYLGPGGKGKRGELVEEIVLPPKGRTLPGAAAHELGHASKSLARHALKTGPARFLHATGAAASIALPLLVVEGAGDGSFATAEDLESRAKVLAGIGTLTGAMQAPVIAEETMAQAKALKYLRRAGASVPETLGKALLHTGPGYSTYLAPLALPFLAAAGLKAKAMYSRATARRDE